MNTRIYRSTSEQILGGVAAGLARAWHLDPWLVRLGFILGTFLTHGLLLPAYLILWAVLPAPSSTAPDTGGIVRENLAEAAARVGLSYPPRPAESAPPPAAPARPGPPLARIILAVLLIGALLSLLGHGPWFAPGSWAGMHAGLHAGMHAGWHFHAPSLGGLFLVPLVLILGLLCLRRRRA